MQGLIMAAQLILGLSILVTLHELGHFLAARAFGIKVEKFYLFFDAWGFKLFSFKKGDCEYGIGWLPLGGYVKIAGMVDESMDKEQMKQPAQDWEFRSKPAWQRLIVMIGGVFVNAVLGVVIFTGVLKFSTKGYLPNTKINDGIYAYELGKKVGLQTGDQILSLDGKPVQRFEDLLSTKILFGSELVVSREGKTIHLTMPENLYQLATKAGRGRFIGSDNFDFTIDSVLPLTGAALSGLKAGDKIYSVANQQVKVYGDFKQNIQQKAGKMVALGVLRGQDSIKLDAQVAVDGTIGLISKVPYQIEKYTMASALSFGFSDAIETLVSNAKGLAMIFKGKEKASESINGPIGIAKIYGGVWDWHRFWTITGLLSMVLAFMNILPIPALDGGHVVFLLLESVTGRKFSDNFMEKAQIVGMVILLALMVFSVGNDVFKHILN